MIEKLARAMYDAEPHVETMAWDQPWVQQPEPGQPNSLADVYRKAARACLQALREPTEAMIIGGAWWVQNNAQYRSSYRTDAIDTWQGMIDAALKEPNQNPRVDGA